MAGILLPACAIFFSGLLCIIYFSKKRVNLLENKMYSVMIISILIDSILVTILVAVAGTLICIAIVRLFTTLRVEKREEQIGLDISQHNETAYPSFNGLD